MSKANLSEKVIVVTGASSGFGRGAALALAKRRAALVLAARRAPLLEELADQCREQGGRAIAVPTDVGLSDEVIVGRVGKLMNAAHGVRRDPVEKMMARNSHRAMIKKYFEASLLRNEMTVSAAMKQAMADVRGYYGNNK